MNYDFNIHKTILERAWTENPSGSHSYTFTSTCEPGRIFLNDTLTGITFTWADEQTREGSTATATITDNSISINLFVPNTYTITRCIFSAKAQTTGITAASTVFKQGNNTLAELFETAEDIYNYNIWGTTGISSESFKTNATQLTQVLYQPNLSNEKWLAENAGVKTLDYSINTNVLKGIQKGYLPRPFKITWDNEAEQVTDTLDNSILINSQVTNAGSDAYYSLDRTIVYFNSAGQIKHEDAIVLYSSDSSGNRLTTGSQLAYTAGINSDNTAYLSETEATQSTNPLNVKSIFKEDSTKSKSISSGVPFVISGIICGGGQSGLNFYDYNGGGKGGLGGASAYIMINFSKILSNTKLLIKLGSGGASATDKGAGGNNSGNNSQISTISKTGSLIIPVLTVYGGGQTSTSPADCTSGYGIYLLSSVAGGTGGEGSNTTKGSDGVSPTSDLTYTLYNNKQSSIQKGSGGSGGEIQSGSAYGGCGGGGGGSIGPGGKGGANGIGTKWPANPGNLGGGGGGGTGSLDSTTYRFGAAGGNGAIILLY